MPVVSIVPMATQTIIGHNLRQSARTSGPVNNCQKLVTSDGTSNSAAACAGDISRLSNPIDTVGSPRPITPFTVPASIKMPSRAKISGSVNVIGLSFLIIPWCMDCPQPLPAAQCGNH
ncbi:hypothetical protein D3C72_1400400 [compost metagenome]